MIVETKAEIAAIRSGRDSAIPDGVSPKRKKIAAYLREHPNETNKSRIAREAGVNVGTVRRHYDAIRKELGVPSGIAPQ